eukprot:scaffold448_cov156-Amphora_coffeaeformis.AAC.12
MRHHGNKKKDWDINAKDNTKPIQQYQVGELHVMTRGRAAVSLPSEKENNLSTVAFACPPVSKALLAGCLRV